MKFFGRLLLPLAPCALALSLSAATIPYIYSLDDLLTGASSLTVHGNDSSLTAVLANPTLNISQFDTTLGTLDTFSIDVALGYTGSLYTGGLSGVATLSTTSGTLSLAGIGYNGMGNGTGNGGDAGTTQSFSMSIGENFDGKVGGDSMDPLIWAALQDTTDDGTLGTVSWVYFGDVKLSL